MLLITLIGRQVYRCARGIAAWWRDIQEPFDIED